MNTLHILGRPIGPGHAPYVVAEMSANHLGDLDRAYAIMRAAQKAGADAVKLQTYTADTITLDSKRPEFQIKGGPWDGEWLHALYDRAHTPWNWHADLFAMGRELGVAVFSAPFDRTAIDLLEQLDAPAYKIASFELVDHDLIRGCAETGKPLIMSTGMASRDEIAEAVMVARTAGARELAVLHCVSGYPTPPEQFNLRKLDTLAAELDVVVGVSDHSPGATIPTAAVALGAAIVEKHVTLARADGGPDAAFSLEPDELAEVVSNCRTVYEALGTGEHRRADAERGSRAFRRSLYVVADVAAGEPFTRENVRSVRPANGLAPKHLEDILGKRAAVSIAGGTPLDWEVVK